MLFHTIPPAIGSPRSLCTHHTASRMDRCDERSFDETSCEGLKRIASFWLGMELFEKVDFFHYVVDSKVLIFIQQSHKSQIEIS